MQVSHSKIRINIISITYGKIDIFNFSKDIKLCNNNFSQSNKEKVKMMIEIMIQKFHRY